MKNFLIIIVLFFNFFFSKDFFSQTTPIDSLQATLVLAKEDTNKVNILSNLANIYFNTGEYNQANNYWNTSLKLSKQLLFLKGEANALYNIGCVYYYQGNYLKALEYFFNSMKLAEKNKDEALMASNYEGVGLIFFRQDDDNKSLIYYKKAMNVYQKNGDKEDEAFCISHIGNIYCRKGDYDTALTYYLKSLQIHEARKDNTGKAYAWASIAVVYFNKKEYEKALQFNFKAIEILKKIGDKRVVGKCLNNIGGNYIELGNYNAAEKYLLDTTYAINDLDNLKNRNLSLSKLYEKQKRWELSFSYYKKYVIFKDSVFNEEKSKQIEELQTKYETKEKEVQINDLNNQKALDDEKIKTATQLQFFLILSIILLFIVGLVIYNRYKTKQKLMLENEKINRERDNIKAENEIMELQQKLLLTQMNPHFIFNSLNSIHSFVIKNKSLEASEYLNDFARLMRLILESSQKKAVSIKEELRVLEYYLKLEKLRAKNSFDYKIKCDVTVHELQIPPFLIQPFVENAILHGLLPLKDRVGKIKIFVNQTNSTILQIIIEDNGIGRTDSAMRRDVNHSSVASSLTEKRTQLLKKQLQKEISIEFVDLQENDIAIGTKVIISISL